MTVYVTSGRSESTDPYTTSVDVTVASAATTLN